MKLLKKFNDNWNWNLSQWAPFFARSESLVRRFTVKLPPCHASRYEIMKNKIAVKFCGEWFFFRTDQQPFLKWKPLLLARVFHIRFAYLLIWLCWAELVPWRRGWARLKRWCLVEAAQFSWKWFFSRCRCSFSLPVLDGINFHPFWGVWKRFFCFFFV